ncbi:Methyl-CpG-binding domain protein 3 [Chelonia mydas]|uniref:Methyl-CpG-binding domain protein 3 n=1 Tax=Chelonia mydas TaxID=8469 RepID=M7ASB6_CHEMY|nr:Methyl-CpG-binding domain protein 3 [Chelonia mydas]
MASAVSMRRLSGLSTEYQSILQDLPFDGKALFAEQTDARLHGMKDSHTTLQTLGLYILPAKFKPQQAPAEASEPRYEPAYNRSKDRKGRPQRRSRPTPQPGPFKGTQVLLGEKLPAPVHVASTHTYCGIDMSNTSRRTPVMEKGKNGKGLPQKPSFMKQEELVQQVRKRLEEALMADMLAHVEEIARDGEAPSEKEAGDEEGEEEEEEQDHDQEMENV